MKFKWMIKMFAAASLALSFCYGNDACSNATLHGNYAFTITGQITAPAPAVGPVSGVAKTYFDGRGNLQQIDHVVHNGIPPQEDWRPGVGTYSINPDCTGWMTVLPEPTVAADNGPELKLYIVVTDDGRKIQTVVSNSPNTPPFAANITSSAVRIESFPNRW